jgi:hypothetical protein
MNNSGGSDDNEIYIPQLRRPGLGFGYFRTD